MTALIQYNEFPWYSYTFNLTHLKTCFWGVHGRKRLRIKTYWEIKQTEWLGEDSANFSSPGIFSFNSQMWKSCLVEVVVMRGQGALPGWSFSDSPSQEAWRCVQKNHQALKKIHQANNNLIIIIAVVFSRIHRIQWARRCYTWSRSVHLIFSPQSASYDPLSTDFTQILTEKLLVSRHSWTLKIFSKDSKDSCPLRVHTGRRWRKKNRKKNADVKWYSMWDVLWGKIKQGRGDRERQGVAILKRSE